MKAANLLDQIRQLELGERLDLVNQIWNELSQDANVLSLTEDERQALDRRLDAYLQDPTATSSWDDVRSRVLEDL